jgi:hypothetical protein
MKTEICEKKALERKSRSYVKKKLHCWTQNLGHQNFFHFIIDMYYNKNCIFQSFGSYNNKKLSF